jgi:hypothetical protein
MDAVAASTIDTLEPYCLAAWQPLPWLASGTYTPGTARDQTRQPSTMQTALGALDRLDPDYWPTRQEPSDAVRKRGRKWLAEQRHIRARGRLATPWAPRPIFFRPLDAEALRCWYRRDALCDWASATTLAATLRDLHDQNPELGEPDELRGEIALAQRLTQELDEAALYWLPPGHTAAHAGSEPLNGDALPELRLPYPSVLLTFADPLALPPANAAGSDAYRGKLVRARRSVPEHNQAPTWRDWTATTVYTPADADRNGAFPHLRELLDHQGAFVEAVLLFADPEGRPRDLFAWCLAIPDIETGQILARTVLAASLSRTAYADVIHNLIAVVGWAEWHPPQRVTGPAASATRVGNSRAEHDRRDEVYVLRAGRGATWIRTSAGDPTSRAGRVRPHRRRGHWRRQHHGPGNQLLKWVRIAPTIVNAHAGPLSPQIYRLPPPPDARS